MNERMVDGFKSLKSRGILVNIGFFQCPLIGAEFERDNIKYIELLKRKRDPLNPKGF